MASADRSAGLPRPANVTVNRRIIVLLLVIFGLWVAWPSNPGIHIGPINKSIRVVRGLDLQGGLRVLLEADLPETVDVTTEQMKAARDIVENRVNALGVSEPVVQVAGNRRILVELPGVTDTEQAISTIRQTALLEFVDFSQVPPAQAAAMQGTTIVTDYGQQAQTGPAPTAEAGGPTPTAESGGPTPTAAPPVFHTVLTGADLESAAATTDQTGRYVVSFKFNDSGGSVFADYTTQHVGDTLAIVLDKKVISAPTISEPITQGSGQITGNFNLESANQLAVQLRYGSLPVPLKVVESKAVGPTLGQDSLDKSLQAGIIGLAVVIVFMVLYYRLPGVVASMALLIYALLTFSLFKLIPVTLTLPGVAGFILSLGMAVDANILIFERMKEELREGKPLRTATDLGWNRAWPSIRDSNLSTIITCVILYWFGSTFGASIVKGFALTLFLGVIVSMFTAIIVTRTLLHLVLDRMQITEHPVLFGI
jgi:preprotein translocase subunit SecD